MIFSYDVLLVDPETMDEKMIRVQVAIDTFWALMLQVKEARLADPALATYRFQESRAIA